MLCVTASEEYYILQEQRSNLFKVIIWLVWYSLKLLHKWHLNRVTSCGAFSRLSCQLSLYRLCLMQRNTQKSHPRSEWLKRFAACFKLPASRSWFVIFTLWRMGCPRWVTPGPPSVSPLSRMLSDPPPHKHCWAWVAWPRYAALV